MPLSREEEKKLIQRSQKGDSSAMADLYENFSTELLRSAILLCRNQEDAQDVVAETFVHFFKSIDKFDIKFPVRPWLHKILRNQANTYFQKRTKSQDLEDGIQNNCEMFEPNQEEAVFINEETKYLQKAMLELGELDRCILESFYFQDLAIKEIASLLKVPDGTIKSRLFYARRALASKIKELFENRSKEE